MVKTQHLYNDGATLAGAALWAAKPSNTDCRAWEGQPGRAVANPRPVCYERPRRSARSLLEVPGFIGNIIDARADRCRLEAQSMPQHNRAHGVERATVIGARG
jgi:hypothetical protein